MEETNTTNANNLIQHERIDEVWKKTMELDLKLSTLNESVQGLLQNLKEMMSKIEKIEQILSEVEIELEESSSEEENNNETVKVEIVTTPETPSQQMQEQTQIPMRRNLMKKIIFG